MWSCPTPCGRSALPERDNNSFGINTMSTLDSPSRWPNIADLLEKPGGHITIGSVAPIERAAIAVTGQELVATLVRRDAESISELLERLDEAIGNALNHGIVTNEVNGGHFRLAPAKVRKKR